MTLRITRRQALKTSAAVAAGVWLEGSVRPVHAAESANEKINIACIGIGGRGAANVGGVKGENIVALCDVDDKTAAKTYAAHKDAKKFYDFRKMFDEIEKEIDAVVVSTPDHSHFHPSMWALQRGKHLYCEKPMAHNVWQCRRMTDFARQQKVATQLGVQRHTIENMHRVVELIKGGAIGKVTEVHSWVGGSRGMPADAKYPKPADWVKWDLWLGPTTEDRSYSPDFCPYKWRFWWDYGTGETGNWGCHILDIPFWALDLKYPTKVSASGPEVDPEKTPKSMQTHFEFPATGSNGPIALHWYHGTPAILKEKGLDGKGANNVFIGSEGTLVCGFNSRKLYPEEKFKDYKAPEQSIAKSPGFYKEWFGAIRGGQPATCQFDYSGPLAETVLLGNVAYRAGAFDWDSQSLTCQGNDKAQALIREEFRKGWELS